MKRLWRAGETRPAKAARARLDEAGNPTREGWSPPGFSRGEEVKEPLGNELVTQLAAAFWDVHAIVAHALDATPESVRETVEAHDAIVTAALNAGRWREPGG
ncbi:hypothetical protein [Streptosporangium amethystogenes]|uniref:hypothetical protein n=1 Tax=Streptosporangium amethystogenes TaxID=2002 RepID=UPI0004C56BD6|nr:hypothetical protein [Streptosporangium amethystogenes]